MELLKILFTALGSIVTLFILTKFMGYRQMSQMSMFDYINGITIGSIAAEMATALDDDFREPLLAMIIYGVVAVIFSILSDKSIVLRRFFVGKPVILYDNKELYYKNLKKAKMDLGEFMTQLRTSGYFDLANVQTAVLESNGKVSILPVSDQRPVTPADLQLKVVQERLVANVIIDGHIMVENLKTAGKNETWLHQQLKSHGFSNVKDIFLATCDGNNKLCVYQKINQEMKRDLLE